jgi:Nickel responsive protein SCO4226-like
VVYVVERYLPGLEQPRLLRMLGKLGQVTEELRAEGTEVRYMGSTIVPDDEACFCQFEGASEAAVAEANERAGVPFARIVEAVAVPVAAEDS